MANHDDEDDAIAEMHAEITYYGLRLDDEIEDDWIEQMVRRFLTYPGDPEDAIADSAAELAEQTGHPYGICIEWIEGYLRGLALMREIEAQRGAEPEPGENAGLAIPDFLRRK